MLRFLTLAQMKTQCRIDADITDDDDYLNQLGEVAEAAVENDLNRRLYASDDEIPETDTTGIAVTVRHQQAMLLMVGQFYENREVTSELTIKEVPLAYNHLIERDRVITV